MTRMSSAQAFFAGDHSNKPGRLSSTTHKSHNTSLGTIELSTLEHRRSKLKRLANNDSIKSVFRWKVSVLRAVLTGIELWISFTVYAVFRCLARLSHDKHISELNLPVPTFTQFGSISAFVSFFVVFFLSQSYSRFVAQFEACASAQGLIANIALVSRVSFANPASVLRLVRHSNAVFATTILGLAPQIYTIDNFLTPLNDKYQFLSPDEMAHLSKIGFASGGSVLREILSWCMETIDTELNVYRRIDAMSAQYLTTQCLLLRGKVGALYDYQFQPIPFSYINLLNLVKILYLPLFAYCFALTPPFDKRSYHEVFDVLLFLLVCISVLGIYCVGSRLQDPFGNDTDDIMIFEMVESALRSSRKVTHASRARPLNLEEEMDLERKRPALDNPFGELAFLSSSPQTGPPEETVTSLTVLESV